VAKEDQRATLGIHVAAGPDANAEEIAEATLQLRRELLDSDSDVEAVALPRAGEPPQGTRAGELPALSALVVTVGTSRLLGSVVTTVRSWLTRSSQRSVKLELDGDALELTGLSSTEQRRLVDEWLRRHESR
jgi:Effector Associated Constant Component 1